MGKKHKARVERIVDVLADKASDCADVARAQRASADRQQEGVDRQHVNAHRLEKLSLSLTNEAEELKEELKEEGLVEPPTCKTSSVRP